MNLSYNILIVDDVSENIKVAVNILKENNYSFYFATNGDKALELVKTNDFDLILLDVIMPGLSGFDVIEILKDNEGTRDIPIICLTAKSDIDSLSKAFDLGAVDYITKPFHSSELISRVASHLELHRSREILKQNNLNLNIKMVKSRDRLMGELESSQKEIIQLLAKLMALTSDETGKHLRRVSEYSKLLATLHSSLSDEEANIIYDASILHDIGKITIPHNILHKEGKLSEEEFNAMKSHTTNAYNILKNSKRALANAACIIAHQHHEKWNGLGYPQGLKGEKIHIYGRIVALADVLDALTHKRVYKQAWSFEDASKYIIEHGGTQFDPYLVDIFKNNIDKFKMIVT